MPTFMPLRSLIRRLSLISLTVAAIAYGASQMTNSTPAAGLSASALVGSLDPAIDSPIPKAVGEQTLVLAGGCFWGMEAVFEHVKGVSNVVSGFSGGSAETAHYERVSFGQTGHAEAVKITYDPAQVSYGKLLKIFFLVAHNPTQLNRQDVDRGTQYRSAIFFANNEQKQIAQAYVDQLNKTHLFSAPIVTQLTPLRSFYTAEDYHQKFVDRNPNYPYVVVHDLPKLDRFRQQFPDLYKQ